MADWSKIGSRGSVDDRRGTAKGLGIAGGGMGLAVFAIITLFNIFNGGNIQLNPNDVLSTLNQVQVGQQDGEQAVEFKGEDDYETFASSVLGSNNDIWRSVFQQTGKTYNDPTLVLFRGGTNSACGFAASQVGPHYCPADQTIYLDETFFEELKTKYGGTDEDVAQAYVISHEVGHHVQNQLGIMSQVQSEMQSSSQTRANQLSVQLELQADCFAGVWANSIKDAGIFGPNEVLEAMKAAEAVGDDRIQQQTQGYITPETWTHGSSQERVDWFTRGWEAGQPSACNTI
ncbi:MAG: neutral zinc metallopeptidase [bacterium]|nr:neutral zinc metallopeptidase [bacterium]